MGPAFEQAPKGDVQKLHRVERAKTPPQPMESDELVYKFTRPRDLDKFAEVRKYCKSGKVRT